MMDCMGGMMGPLMALLMGLGILGWLLVLVVLALLAVWLFQRVRRGPDRTRSTAPGSGLGTGS
jgi:hypothetical protein